MVDANDPSATANPVTELAMSTLDPYSDPAAFWAAQGNGMTAPWDPIADATPDQARQEAKILEMLRPLIRTKAIRSIFEAGCGRGRLAHFFARTIPDATYAAIDVGVVQLGEAQRLRPDGKFFLGDITAPEGASQWVPGVGATEGNDSGDFTFDLTVTSEVLMHVRPGAELAQAFENLVRLTKLGGHILIVEWVPTQGELEAAPTAYWNFPHDYRELVYVSAALARREIGAIESVRTDRQMIFLIDRLDPNRPRG